MKPKTAEKAAKSLGRRRFLSQLLLVLMFLVGILVALYPFYINALNNFIDDYRVEQAQKELTAKQESLAKKAKENEELAKRGLSPEEDPFGEEQSSTGKNAAYYQEHLLGRVMIPAIKVDIPLYDVTNQTLLDRGATVLQGASFPTGGADTHTLISAHSGLPERKLFTDLEDLKKGDQFVLEVYGQKLAYEVERIETVLPTETESLKIEAGRDLATLITCTPYMVNSHRLLVTGHRVPYTEKLAKAIAESNQSRTWQQVAIIAATLLAILLILVLLAKVIRGYLLSRRRYNLILRRLDAADEPVTAARYQLFRGRRPLKRGGQPLIEASDENGLIRFTNLPGGVYLLKELTPDRSIKVKVGTKKRAQEKMLLYPKKKQDWILNQRIIKK